jgi:hypothetical protein
MGMAAVLTNLSRHGVTFCFDSGTTMGTASASRRTFPVLELATSSTRVKASMMVTWR